MNDALPAGSWKRFCERLTTFAESAAGPEFPGTDADRLAMIEHLVDQAVLWPGWEVLHADPTRPAFHRHNDLTSQWGGPNADNVYRHARIAPGHRYRVRGRMHSCEDFILALRAGFMHAETWGTLRQLSSMDRAIGRGDEFEILLGGDDPAALPIPEGTVMVSVREYYHRWEEEEPATWVIECLDAPETPSALTSALLDARLDAAAEQIERSVTYWNEYMREARAERSSNSFAAPQKLAKGLSVARYAFCFWDLAPEEALVIESDVPDARYVSLQLYRLGTFELVDPYGRLSSRNQTQLEVRDGRFTAVLSARDVGVANWLETGGLERGLCTLRWFWPENDRAPSPTCRVVPVEHAAEEARGVSPVTASQRTAERAARRRHLQWRFRT